MWINGPFPAGAWPDLNITQSSLIHFLDENEFYHADGGYSDGFQWADTPTGLNDYEARTKAVARARHETCNGRFKVFRCLKDQCRHSREMHGSIFRAVANIVQFTIQHGQPLFQIEYDEEDFDWEDEE